MLLMSNSRTEVEEIINELASLELSYNLRLNKKKSEILTAEDADEIAGVRCRQSVKYLGVKVTVDRSEQRKIAKEQIHRNLNALRWKLKGEEPNVAQHLLPSQVTPHLYRHTYGGCGAMEEAGYRQPGGGPLPQDTLCR